MRATVEDPVSQHIEEATYRQLWPGLVRLARLLTASQALAEDLAQDAFVGLLKAGKVERPEAYLRRSVVNLATNSRRRARRERLHLATIKETVVCEPSLDELWPLIVRLPPRQRAAVVLRYYLDLSEADTATAMGCRPGTVKAHLNKALTHLREEASQS